MANTYTDSNPDPNIRTFNEREVVEYYASLQRLTPCEKLLFDSYLRRGMAILDLGVGGGRTTSYLSSIASRYVGIDYAAEMVAICRKRFQQLSFEVGEAADLSIFSSASFDAAVMAFNGLDYVIPDESRIRALCEIRRVLKPGGVFIFSSHNPRSIWARPSWNPERLRSAAQTILRKQSIFFRPLLECLTAVRVVIAWIQALFRSLGRIARRVPTRTFWRGHGYWRDSAHGGLETHFSVPQKIADEFLRFGFQVRRVLGDDYPVVSGKFATDWYYYVFQTESDGGE